MLGLQLRIHAQLLTVLYVLLSAKTTLQRAAAHTNLEEVADARELSIVNEADGLPLLPWTAGCGVGYSGCSLSCPVSSSLDGYGLPTERPQAAQPNAAKPPCRYSITLVPCKTQQTHAWDRMMRSKHVDAAPTSS